MKLTGFLLLMVVGLKKVIGQENTPKFKTSLEPYFSTSLGFGSTLTDKNGESITIRKDTWGGKTSYWNGNQGKFPRIGYDIGFKLNLSTGSKSYDKIQLFSSLENSGYWVMPKNGDTTLHIWKYLKLGVINKWNIGHGGLFPTNKSYLNYGFYYNFPIAYKRWNQDKFVLNNDIANIQGGWRIHLSYSKESQRVHGLKYSIFFENSGGWPFRNFTPFNQNYTENGSRIYEGWKANLPVLGFQGSIPVIDNFNKKKANIMDDQEESDAELRFVSHFKWINKNIVNELEYSKKNKLATKYIYNIPSIPKAKNWKYIFDKQKKFWWQQTWYNKYGEELSDSVGASYFRIAHYNFWGNKITKLPVLEFYYPSRQLRFVGDVVIVAHKELNYDNCTWFWETGFPKEIVTYKVVFSEKEGKQSVREGKAYEWDSLGNNKKMKYYENDTLINVSQKHNKSVLENDSKNQQRYVKLLIEQDSLSHGTFSIQTAHNYFSLAESYFKNSNYSEIQNNYQIVDDILKRINRTDSTWFIAKYWLSTHVEDNKDNFQELIDTKTENVDSCIFCTQLISPYSKSLLRQYYSNAILKFLNLTKFNEDNNFKSALSKADRNYVNISENPKFKINYALTLCKLYQDFGLKSKAIDYIRKTGIELDSLQKEVHPKWIEPIDDEVLSILIKLKDTKTLELKYPELNTFASKENYYRTRIALGKATNDDKSKVNQADLLNLLVLSGDSLNNTLPLTKRIRYVKKAIEKIHNPINRQSVYLRNILGKLYLDNKAIKKADKETDSSLAFFKSYVINTLNWGTESQKQEILDYNLVPFLGIVGDSAYYRRLYEYQLSIKSVILDDTRKKMIALKSSENPNDKKIYDDLIKYRNLLNTSIPVELRIGTESKIDSLENVANKKYKFHKQVNLKDISKKLNKDQIAIEFGFDITKDIFYALLLNQNGGITYETLCSDTELLPFLPDEGSGRGEDSNKGKEANHSPNENKQKKFKELSKSIWNKIEFVLQKDSIKTIYFSPSRLLNKVPFGALPVDTVDNTGTQTLSQKYNLVQLLSTRSVATGETTDSLYFNKNMKVQLYGGIDYGLENDFLSNTLAEANAIDSLLRTKITDPKNITKTTGKKANEQHFKDLSGQKSSIIHVATHGFSNPQDTTGKRYYSHINPLERSGLLFACGSKNKNAALTDTTSKENDGILTAQEIANLDLSGTDLVDLSACRTALGEIKGSEGVFGLQRAFKMAGARYIMMSLWNVDDEATSFFMKTFYENWTNGKIGINTAFRKTQLEMQKHPKYKEPYYWAGFVLVE